MDSNIFDENLKALVLERVENENVLSNIETLGILKEDLVFKANTPLDTLSLYLSKKLGIGKFVYVYFGVFIDSACKL